MLTTPKNITNIFTVMTFFNNIASGNDKPTTAIEKAIAVPNGIPFWTITCIIGSIPAVFVYIGTPNKTAIGTANGLSLLMYCSKKLVGMKPCINPPIATPIIMYIDPA